MEIYHDILIGLERESKNHNPIKATRVQHHSNLSYDKFSRHLKDMAAKDLVTLSPLSITEKGRDFVREYNKIREFMREIGARFFETEPPLQNVALDLVANLPPIDHSVLLYDDRRYADLVALAFLSDGLAKGESCVYLTSEDPRVVEQRLIELGWNGRRNRADRLRIYQQLPKTPKRSISFKDLEKLIRDSTMGMKPPHRVFGNQFIVRDPQGQLVAEKLLHERFETLGITMLCWYDLKKIPRALRSRFIESIVDRHSHVIFASERSKAFGFDTSLLRYEV